MMSNTTTDPRRIKVWEAMAEHYLDTETRHDIPRTALCCVEAGLSCADACDVWRYEVTPAVWFNAWDVAGEWAGWPSKWLERRVERLRQRWPNKPGLCASLIYRSRAHYVDSVWRSIARCLDALVAAGSLAASQQLAEDLAFLARHYFDFSPSALGDLGSVRQARIRQLYPELFQTVMAPALVPGEVIRATRRVRVALRL